MRSRTLHPHGLLDSYSHNGQHAADTVYRIIRVLPPGILAYKTSSVLHYANFPTKQQHRQQCCSPREHTAQRAALYIAHCSYDTYNATTLGDITAELANATTYDCVIRAERKIEDRDRDSDLGDLD